MDKIYALIGVIVLFFIDKYTKLWAIKNIKDKEPINIIDGVFELSYVENKGAAWGMFEGATLFFALITLVVLVAVIWVFISLGKSKKDKVLKFALVVFTSGVLGNFYERMLYHKVVDMLHFYLIEYPVFNVADVFIVISSILIAVLLIFFYKEDELKFMKFGRNKNA